MKFRESAIAHKYLDGLNGIEIGGSAHNPFGLDTINVDYTDDMETIFKREEYNLCGEKMAVDVVANGDELPFDDESYDFVISSHVIEHFYNPIKAIKEWLRVIRPGGYILFICPKECEPLTDTQELLSRTTTDNDDHRHWTRWTSDKFMEVAKIFNWNVVEKHNADDKVGNGFLIVIKK
jgi:ubiquinone/menaquinone biosynthesis C-methylase UbiE